VTVSFFKDAAELDEYIGGVFRDAGNHPESGPKLRAADIVMRVLYTEPDAEVTVLFKNDYRVIAGPADVKPDITLLMRGDTADQFWRGEYNLAIGLAKGQVKAKGPVNKILKLVPLTKPLFPMYREKVAKKDAEAKQQ
jgi:putative sterol carrier protein